MRAGGRRRPGGGLPGVELVAGVAEPELPSRDTGGPGSSRNRRRTLVVAGVVAAYLGLLAVTSTGVGPQAVEEPTEHFQFGDPFAVDWRTLEPQIQPAPAVLRSEPMAGRNLPCVGFGRPDWPETARQPTVAYCLDLASSATIDDGAIVIKQARAGFDTWYLLLFLEAPEGLEAWVDGEALARDRVYWSGDFAALLVPQAHERIEVRWTIGTTCVEGPIDRGRIAAAPCETS